MSSTENIEAVENRILQLVTFKIGDEEFGFDIFKVKEINRMLDITQMPNSQSSVKGVVNLRGSVIPVISLRNKLNFSDVEYNKDTRIIVVEYKSKSIAFIVDEVSEVLRIQTSIIEKPPEMTTSVESAYINGVAKLENRLLILLDFDKMLTSQEEMELESV